MLTLGLVGAASILGFLIAAILGGNHECSSSNR